MSKVHAYYTALNYPGPAAAQMRANLILLREENKRRRPCPDCGLQILPEMLARHAAIVHQEGEA